MVLLMWYLTSTIQVIDVMNSTICAYILQFVLISLLRSMLHGLSIINRNGILKYCNSFLVTVISGNYFCAVYNIL